MKITPYLFYDGTCEEAFKYYEGVFGGEVAFLQRYSDMPENKEFPIPDELMDKIMHMSIKIGEDFIFGSDAGPWGEAKRGSFSVAVSFDSEEKLDKAYKILGKDGKVLMPLDMQFWGAKYGKVEDKFGIVWDLNYSECK